MKLNHPTQSPSKPCAVFFTIHTSQVGSTRTSLPSESFSQPLKIKPARLMHSGIGTQRIREKKQRNEMRALYFRYRRDCLSAAELAFIWRQSTHSLSLSQRSTCNLGLSAKKRPYRSFTHHPRKTTFFKRLLVKHGSDSFRSIGSTIPSHKHIIRSVYSHCGTAVAPSVFRQLFFDGVSPPSPRSLDCSEKEFHTPEITRLCRRSGGRGIVRLL